VILILLSLIIIIIDSKYKNLDYKKNFKSAITYPFYYLVITPKKYFDNAIDYLTEQRDILSQLEQIKSENSILKAKQLKLDSVQNENSRLRELLNSTAQLNDKFLISEILDVAVDPLGKRFVINKGTKDGVYDGQAVVSSKGVVGQVIEANLYTSFIILITDADHAIPLENSRTGMRTLGMGLGASQDLELSNVLKDTDIKVGDLFVSSGLGERFPAGYPVGVVKDIKYENKKPTVRVVLKPVVDIDLLKEVLLLWSVKEESKKNFVHNNDESMGLS